LKEVAKGIYVVLVKKMHCEYKYICVDLAGFGTLAFKEPYQREQFLKS
jgi:hypothetical protein